MLVFLASLTLSGCAALLTPSVTLFSADVAIKREIFVASMRERNVQGRFGLGRAEKVAYSISSVSVPYQRKIGTITSEKNQSDASRFFVNLGDQPFQNADQFTQAVAQNAASKSDQPEVLIFVHGFNSGFDKSLFRLAQIDQDFHLPSTQILYAWPSANQLTQYIHDLDSIAYARNGLEELIRNLTNSGVKRIVLTGHSMGAALVMETMRQMYIKSGREALRKIDSVVFFSPDMDLDVFVQTAKEIAPLPENFVIYTSSNDWLLPRFSKYLTFGQDRLGRPDDVNELNDLNITVVDVSLTETDDKSTHLALAASAPLIRAVNAMGRPDIARFGSGVTIGSIPGAQIVKHNRLSAIVLPRLH